MMPGYRGARASQSRRRVHEGSSPASCFGPPTLPLGARPTRRCLDHWPVVSTMRARHTPKP
jgi:hypothetical protein